MPATCPSVTMCLLPTATTTTTAGGPDAPDLNESLTNLGINVTAVAVLSWLVYRDVSSKQAELRITTREEGLGRLQVGGAGRWRRWERCGEVEAWGRCGRWRRWGRCGVRGGGGGGGGVAGGRWAWWDG